jgi:DNA-directed RNA polymerase specialized sigma24 family protein
MRSIDREHVVDRWKLDLIRARAVRRGFRGADLSDVQQEVLLQVLGFRFQPERGATEATALTALIDRRLSMARRRQRRYERHLERAETFTDASEAARSSRQEEISRSLDLQSVVGSLAPEYQELCRMLSAGHSAGAIAHQLGCGWHTVKRRNERLRDIFVEMGMDGYLR